MYQLLIDWTTLILIFSAFIHALAFVSSKMFLFFFLSSSSLSPKAELVLVVGISVHIILRCPQLSDNFVTNIHWRYFFGFFFFWNFFFDCAWMLTNQTIINGIDESRYWKIVNQYTEFYAIYFSTPHRLWIDVESTHHFLSHRDYSSMKMLSKIAPAGKKKKR